MRAGRNAPPPRLSEPLPASGDFRMLRGLIGLLNPPLADEIETRIKEKLGIGVLPEEESAAEPQLRAVAGESPA